MNDQAHDREVLQQLMHEAAISGVRMGIAAAKEEIESLLGKHVIENRDDGSPYGRAFIRCCESLREMYERKP